MKRARHIACQTPIRYVLLFVTVLLEVARAPKAGLKLANARPNGYIYFSVGVMTLSILDYAFPAPDTTVWIYKILLY